MNRVVALFALIENKGGHIMPINYDKTYSYAERYSVIWKPITFFHIRQTTSGVTLVCTIPMDKIAMRGNNKSVNQAYIERNYDMLKTTVIKC
jgi:hypothetical protein